LRPRLRADDFREEEKEARGGHSVHLASAGSNATTRWRIPPIQAIDMGGSEGVAPIYAAIFAPAPTQGGIGGLDTAAVRAEINRRWGSKGGGKERRRSGVIPKRGGRFPKTWFVPRTSPHPIVSANHCEEPRLQESAAWSLDRKMPFRSRWSAGSCEQGPVPLKDLVSIRPERRPAVPRADQCVGKGTDGFRDSRSRSRRFSSADEKKMKRRWMMIRVDMYGKS